jgi:hypothetical protein
MSSFWAQKLGGVAAPAAAPSPSPQQAYTAPWWDSSQGIPPRPVEAPQTVSLGQPQQGQQKPSAKPQVTRQDTNCPDCGGDTFFKPVGMPNAMSQCYECGFNSRFQQSTQGLPSDRSADSTPSKQTAVGGGQKNNYHPGVFIKSDGTT